MSVEWTAPASRSFSMDNILVVCVMDVNANIVVCVTADDMLLVVCVINGMFLNTSLMEVTHFLLCLLWRWHASCYVCYGDDPCYCWWWRTSWHICVNGDDTLLFVLWRWHTSCKCVTWWQHTSCVVCYGEMLPWNCPKQYRNSIPLKNALLVLRLRIKYFTYKQSSPVSLMTEWLSYGSDRQWSTDAIKFDVSVSEMTARCPSHGLACVVVQACMHACIRSC